MWSVALHDSLFPNVHPRGKGKRTAEVVDIVAKAWGDDLAVLA